MNTAEGWTVGDDGTILHSTTAGNVWKQMETKTQTQTWKRFYSLAIKVGQSVSAARF